MTARAELRPLKLTLIRLKPSSPRRRCNVSSMASAAFGLVLAAPLKPARPEESVKRSFPGGEATWRKMLFRRQFIITSGGGTDASFWFLKSPPVFGAEDAAAENFLIALMHLAWLALNQFNSLDIYENGRYTRIAILSGWAYAREYCY